MGNVIDLDPGAGGDDEALDPKRAVWTASGLRNVDPRAEFHIRGEFTQERCPYEAALAGDHAIAVAHIYLVNNGHQNEGSNEQRGAEVTAALETVCEQLARLGEALGVPYHEGEGTRGDPLPRKLERMVKLVERRGLRIAREADER